MIVLPLETEGDELREQREAEQSGVRVSTGQETALNAKLHFPTIQAQPDAHDCL